MSVTKDETKVLGDIGKALARGVAKDPGKAALLLVLVVVAIVVLAIVGATVRLDAQSRTLIVVVGLFVVLALAVLIIAALVLPEMMRNAQQVVAPVPPSVTSTQNTVALAAAIPPEKKAVIRATLREAALDVAEAVGVPESEVRANIFGRDDGKAHIIKDLTCNMNRAEELDVSMPIGEGSTGFCFSSGRVNLAVFEKSWGVNALDAAEMKKVHPDLRWIISVPIFAGNERPLWVMNIDGTSTVPSERLRAAVPQLTYWSELITQLLKEVIT